MGGRGTFAAGKVVPYTFRTVGKIWGIKVLEGIGSAHGLPHESHSSNAYIQLNPNGTVRTLRFYDSSHRIKLEIAKHQEVTLDPSGKDVLHYHVYEYGKGAGKEHGSARKITKAMRKRFGKLFEGSWK